MDTLRLWKFSSHVYFRFFLVSSSGGGLLPERNYSCSSDCKRSERGFGLATGHRQCLLLGSSLLKCILKRHIFSCLCICTHPQTTRGLPGVRKCRLISKRSSGWPTIWSSTTFQTARSPLECLTWHCASEQGFGKEKISFHYRQIYAKWASSRDT